MKQKTGRKFKVGVITTLILTGIFLTLLFYAEQQPDGVALAGLQLATDTQEAANTPPQKAHNPEARSVIASDSPKSGHRFLRVSLSDYDRWAGFRIDYLLLAFGLIGYVTIIRRVKS